MRIGILGGGQLGRMLALAGIPLGLQFRFLDPVADAPVRDVGELIVADPTDIAAQAKFANGLDVVTYEFENIPVTVVESLASSVPVFPPPKALAVAQDRLLEKKMFTRLGIGTPKYAPVSEERELKGAIERIGLPAVLKTRRMGYDGRGQYVLKSNSDILPAFRTLAGQPLLLEEFVSFTRELSIIAVRSKDKSEAIYPLSKNDHRDGILRQSIAPVSGLPTPLIAEAQRIAGKLLSELDYVGVLAIELFESEGRLFANEMAPRVHNSGHWTIEGAQCSQFENHLRAGLGWPLGVTRARGNCAMINFIGDAPAIESLLAIPGLRMHFYGKAPRPGRKIGHATFVADNESELNTNLSALRAICERG